MGLIDKVLLLFIIVTIFMAGYYCGHKDTLKETVNQNYSIAELIQRIDNLSADLDNWSQDIREDLTYSRQQDTYNP